MTNQEAIKTLYEYRHCLWDKLYEPICMAIKALEQEPSGDLISRQAVDELSKELVHTTRDKADFLCNFWEGLQKLPPVNPQEPKTGHWIWGVTGHECSSCGGYTCFEDSKPPKFCPNCGARMIENREQESQATDFLAEARGCAESEEV